MLFLTKITELFTAFERIFCALYFTLPLLNTAVVSCSVVNLRFAIVRLIRWARCALYLIGIIGILTLLIILLLCDFCTQVNNLLLVILLAHNRYFLFFDFLSSLFLPSPMALVIVSAITS